MNTIKNLKFVLGKAGTGKTTTILNSLKDLKGSSGTSGQSPKILCIAYTHSAVENLRNKSNNRFKS